MKKIILITISLFITSVSFGHGYEWPNKQRNFKDKNNKFWQEMNVRHEVMHDTVIKTKNIDSGVILMITVSSDKAFTALKDEFLVSQKDMTDYFKPVQVTLTNKEKEFQVELSSNDKDLVNQLQSAGNGLFYEYIHQSMFRSVSFNNRFGFHGRHHMMGGYNGHMGWRAGNAPGNFQGCPNYNME